MHPRILAERAAIAAERLTAAAHRLAKALELPAEMVNDLTPDENNNQVKPMLVLEACANLVAAAADKLDNQEKYLVNFTLTNELVVDKSESPATIADTSDVISDEGLASIAEKDGAAAKTKVKRGGSK
jgi:hypothetical protein